MIRQVWRNAFSDQILVTIPNNGDIHESDFVEITRVVPKIVTGKCTRCRKKYTDHTLRELKDHKLLDKVFEYPKRKMLSGGK